MTVKVCAHMNLGPFTHLYTKAPSMAQAIRKFRREVERHYGVLDSSIAEIRGTDMMPCVDLYPACPDGGDLCCTSHENFHDYPMARYEVGVRGGIKKVTV